MRLRYRYLIAVLVLAACSTSGLPGSRPLSPVPKVAAPHGLVNPAVASTWPLPDDKLTPGQVTSACTYPRSTTERVVTTATKLAAAAEYHYAGPTGLAYIEYDHRIPFALCGGNGLANIWPEPVDGVPTSIYVHNRKDQLEAYAAREVRYKKWTLPFAQSIFVGDWRAAWCKYLHYAGVTC